VQGKEVKPEHIRIIRKNLPLLTEYWGVEPYQGDESYNSLFDYMKEAERVLVKRGNKITLQAEAVTSAFIRQNGKDALLQLKRDNYNTKLEDCVIGADQQRMLDVVDDCIVPRTGIIFLTPRSQIGRAPFYSSEKIIGSHPVKTLWFNMAVLMLMSIIVTILLQTDCPGRYMRKQ
jgi:hypothetical protein